MTMPIQLGLFEENNFDELKRLNRLTILGDRLSRLNEIINWVKFRPELRKVFRAPLKSFLSPNISLVSIVFFDNHIELS